MWLQVTPHSTSSGFAGVRFSGCPESRIHSALPAVFKFRVPPQLYFARRASRCITGFPGVCIFRPCRRSIVELPRLSYPSAPLLRQLQVSPPPRTSSCACRYRFQVAPAPASSGFAGNGSSSYPESLVLRHPRCLSSRLPLNSALAVAPPDDAVGSPTSLIFRLGLRFESSGFPGFSLPRRRLMDYRVSSALASSGSAVPASSGFPESCIYGWVDDWIPVFSNFASSVFTADESSYPSGLCRFCIPTLNAFFQSHSCFPLTGEPAYELLTSTASCIVQSERNCISNSLVAHQLKRSLGLLNLWKQVQKTSNSVDFTSVGA